MRCLRPSSIVSAQDRLFNFLMTGTSFLRSRQLFPDRASNPDLGLKGEFQPSLNANYLLYEPMTSTSVPDLLYEYTDSR